MASLNRVSLLGNIGKDPEIRYQKSGEPVASFSLATSEKWTDKGGQKQESTQWHSVSVFGKLAEIVRDYCAKGKQVFIEGSIKYDEWTDKDGNKRNTTKIVLSGPGAKLILLGGGEKRGSGGSGSAPAPNTGDFQVDSDDVPFVAFLAPLAGALLGLAGLVA